MSKGDLFSDSGERTPPNPAPNEERALQIERSSLWAAYGDAIGWISELTDEVGLKRRTGGAALNRPIDWNRRVGGRSGVRASLPAGCYSDDSQLRLATSRAIRPDGFDVEAFAKVELPVWLSYGLGGGKSTSAAAEQLSRPKSVWWSNKFRGWTQSGGNGAAMRIQPHVWASCSSDPAAFLPAVVRNSVCTHSHPNGILGAVLHALCVAHAMNFGRPPSRADLPAIVDAAACLPETIASDPELSFWRVAFEQEAGAFHSAWERTVGDLRKAIGMVDASKMHGEDGYAAVVNALDLRDPKRRGSGMLTALAAVALTWCEPCPVEAMRIAANALGTDTDTIATMAGAILGAAADTEPPVDVLDGDLFRSEARRLARIAAGEVPPSYAYPDLLRWKPPRTRADALAQTKDGDLMVLGLGPGQRLGGDAMVGGGGFRWQWVKLKFGQTLLIKSRNILPEAPADSPPQERRKPDIPGASPNRRSGTADDLRDVRDHPTHALESTRTRYEPAGTHDVREVVSFLEQHIHDDRMVGRTLRRVVQKGTNADIAAFTAALVRMLDRAGPAEQKGTLQRTGPGATPTK
ncbi:MAG: ADP-ribosylglycohydrolase family protein [Gammaproteobacteria bacterium]|nr:ADP-ribosylglycohydrolase family protein [Gammaproteobacteria bacterium]